MTHSPDYYLTGAIALHIESPSTFESWRIKRGIQDSRILTDSGASSLTLNLKPLTHVERTSVLALCGRTVKSLQLILYNGRNITVNVEDRKRLRAESVFFPYPCETATSCIFLDDNINCAPKQADGAVSSAMYCRLGKALLEEMAAVDGINEWKVSGVEGASTAYVKKGRKYVAVDSEVKVGDQCHFEFTIPEEYGGRTRQLKNPETSFDAGTIEVTVHGKKMKLEVGPVEDGIIPQQVGPGAANFQETHDALLVALGAGWLPNLAYFDPIQRTIMDAGVESSVHVTLDAADFMMSVLTRAYSPESRAKTEDDGIRRYAVVIDSNEARNNAVAANAFIWEALGRIRREPRKRLLILT